MTPDCIRFFGLDWPCTEEALTRAYRRLMRQFHPDVHGGDAAASNATMLINRMYEQAVKYVRCSTVPPASPPLQEPPVPTTTRAWGIHLGVGVGGLGLSVGLGAVSDWWDGEESEDPS